MNSKNLQLLIGSPQFKHVLKGSTAEIHLVVYKHLESEGTLLGLIDVCGQETKVLILFRNHGLLPHYS